MTSDNLVLLAGTGTRWLQLFVSLSLLIILHEFGHYFFAKRFKMRVEKFYLFFDFLFPFSGLLNFSLLKKKIGDTLYGIGWFPLGGYVKIAGMVDESMDKEELAQPPKEWEYRSKPAYMRLLTMLGGIIVNVLVAVIIYSVIMGVWGEEYLPTANAKYGIVADSLGKANGFKDGDIIVSVNGQKTERWNQLKSAIVINSAKEVNVLRDGVPVMIKLSSGTVAEIVNNKADLFEVRVPAIVGEVQEKSNAEKMGMKTDDSIISINGQRVTFFDDTKAKVESLKNHPIQVTVVRQVNNSPQIFVLNGSVDSTGILGFGTAPMNRLLKMETIHYSFFGAIERGFTYTGEQFVSYLKGFSLLFKKGVSVSKNLGGIGTFSKVFSTSFNMEGFLHRTAFISIILAFMNLLPIPGLDGGYVIFLLYELITRRKVSDKVMEVATTVGLVLLLGLMLYANGLDIFRHFKGQ